MVSSFNWFLRICTNSLQHFKNYLATGNKASLPKWITSNHYSELVLPRKKAIIKGGLVKNHISHFNCISSIQYIVFVVITSQSPLAATPACANKKGQLTSFTYQIFKWLLHPKCLCINDHISISILLMWVDEFAKRSVPSKGTQLSYNQIKDFKVDNGYVKNREALILFRM